MESKWILFFSMLLKCTDCRLAGEVKDLTPLSSPGLVGEGQGKQATHINRLRSSDDRAAVGDGGWSGQCVGAGQESRVARGGCVW